MLFTILAASLIGLAVGPLVLLGVYLAADALKIPFAERILAALVPALSVQWFIGGVVNLMGGLALAGLGVWETLPVRTPVHRVVGVVVIAAGLWRAWRGGLILLDLVKPREPRAKRRGRSIGDRP